MSRRTRAPRPCEKIVNMISPKAAPPISASSSDRKPSQNASAIASVISVGSISQGYVVFSFARETATRPV